MTILPPAHAVDPSALPKPPSLLAIRGPLTGARLSVQVDTFTIGRAPECDLVLPDATVSRQHAEIARVRLAWIVRDRDSAHGVFVNRQRIVRQQVLQPNDELQIGESIFLFNSDFDLQNADYSDRSVFYTGPTEDTIEFPRPRLDEPPRRTEAPTDGIELLVELGRLFGERQASFGEALNAAADRTARLFRAEVLSIMLWDSAAGTLRPAAVVAPGDVLADMSVLRRVHAEARATLLSDRPNFAPHPSPSAPPAPTVRSLMAAPILAEGHSIGVLHAERYELDAYSLKDLRVLQAIAALLGVFVEARQRAEALELRRNFLRSDSPLIGNSDSFRAVLDMVLRIADTPATVLLTGETGTGKEVLAREIHRLSAGGRAGAPFVALNCAAIPESLFESELFGHEKGSFTGAIRQQRGLVEQAHGGTLFLDEIGELSLAMQPKFLRFLQERTFQRVGGSKVLRANVRLIAATNRDLTEEVRSGRFREDLFHRISVLPLTLPPLRERRSDIRALAESFLRRHAAELGREIAGVTDEAMIALERYDWPGNIRELSNCVERAVLLCDGPVLLPRHFQLAPSRSASTKPADDVLESLRTLEDVERDHILRVLHACGDNQVKAAERLGIHRNTLRNKLQQYGIG